jgi:hypothetical protein
MGPHPRPCLLTTPCCPALLTTLCCPPPPHCPVLTHPPRDPPRDPTLMTWQVTFEEAVEVCISHDAADASDLRVRCLVWDKDLNKDDDFIGSARCGDGTRRRGTLALAVVLCSTVLLHSPTPQPCSTVLLHSLHSPTP